ncbi:MAG: DUF192 domain-containing protein [Gammaproteobacteria bacterium]
MPDRALSMGPGPGRAAPGFVGRVPHRDDEGILMTPCRVVHTFGLFGPIDIVYLDRHLRVLKCEREVPPWRISTCRRARTALGLAPGAAKRRGLVPGLQVAWRTA